MPKRFRFPFSDRRLIDAVGVLFVTALAELQLVSTEDLTLPKEKVAAFILVQTLPLALRRIFPVAVVGTMLTGDLALLTLSGVSDESVPALSYVALIIGIYTVANQRRRAVSIPVAVGVMATVFIAALAAKHGTEVGWLVFSLVAPFTAAWFVGDHLRTRGILTAALTARTMQLEREREVNARQAVLAERTRIARELHDVVAHSLSVVVVQAAAARRVLDQEPAKARASLEAIETTARDALSEMRRLLGVLRHGEGEERALAPQPGLSQLESLLATMRGAGLPVDLIVEGVVADLPAGLDLSAYRVVQEGLTNALKHANATRATVRIDYRGRELEIEVRDDGVGGSSSRDGQGQGLIGMRERVAIYGGTLECGPQRGGGFAVRARFPAQAAG